MTRTATTKLVATALAVASLGLASTAQADDGAAVPDQPAGAAAGAGAAQVDPAPAQQDAQDNGQAAVADQDPPEKSQEQLDKERFERYCNTGDAEPSHSDKAFCDEYRKTHGGGTTTPIKTQPRPIGHDSSTTDPTDTTEPTYPSKPYYHHTQPTYYHQTSAPSKSSLPFTGLEIWQLGLLGLVLAGGGLGVRRLLAS